MKDGFNNGLCPIATGLTACQKIAMASIILGFPKGGTYHNYYIWYGRNHMRRWAASGIANKYADGVNLHSDMLPNEPKRTHLTRLHNLISHI